MPALHFRARRGFALPLALFFIGIMTVTIAASYMMTSGERRTNQSAAAMQRAYESAYTGLETYIGGRGDRFGLTGPPGGPTFAGESLQFSPSNDRLDSAYVVSRLLRKEAGTPGSPGYIPAMFVVRAFGRHYGNRLPGTAPAERAVGMITLYERGNLQVLAGWTSLTGLRKNGAAGTLSGVDACAAADGGGAQTVAGVAVPSGEFSGNSSGITGYPTAIRDLGTQQQAEDAVKIDWVNIKNGTAINADFTDRWPTSAQYDNPDFWPIIHWRGDNNIISLPKIHDKQRGMLIIDGDLVINGNTTWDGIILVGGNLTSNGNNTVYGAVVTGLNQKIGEDVISNEESDFGNGTKIYQYHSCNVRNAASAMGAMRPVRNTFVDNWRTW